MVLEIIKKFKICEPAFIDQYFKTKWNANLLKFWQRFFAVKHHCDGHTWWTCIKYVRLSQHFLQLQEACQNISYAVIKSIALV